MEWINAGRATLRRAGFVVHRWPGNRFAAMEDALRLLHRSGFRPRVVIDWGANCGQWFEVAKVDIEGHELPALASRARDLRLRIGDAIFVRRDSPLAKDVSWD